MGTTSEKLTYLNTTKSELKQAINNIGGEVTDETTFREYVNQLENAYDNLPKTEYQEGTEINLGVTIKGKLDFEDDKVGYGQTEQDGEPTPSSQIPIKCVAGKNKFDKNAVTQNAYINTSGEVVTGATGYCASDWIKVGTGNIVWGATSGNGYSLSIYNSSKTFVRAVERTNNNAMVIPIANGEEYIRFTILNADLNTMQIEEGTQATQYLPYNTIEEVVSGKNRFDISTVTLNKAINASGEVITNYNFCYSDYIKVQELQNYILSYRVATTETARIHFYNSQKTWLSQTNGTSTTGVSTLQCTTPSNCEYVRISIHKTGEQIQFEQGSTATTYEPYITPTSYQLSLGDIELNAIGNYKDELIYDVDEDKVYKNEKIGKVVFTGASSESWNFVSVSESKKRNYIAVDDIITSIQDSETSPIKCNYFINGSYSDGASPSGSINIITGRSGIAQINIFHNIADSNANFKTWLSTHNTEVRYVKAQANQIQITDTTLINQVKALYNAHSNNGTTIITSNGNLPMIIKVRGLKGE